MEATASLHVVNACIIADCDGVFVQGSGEHAVQRSKKQQFQVQSVFWPERKVQPTGGKLQFLLRRIGGGTGVYGVGVFMRFGMR